MSLFTKALRNAKQSKEIVTEPEPFEDSFRDNEPREFVPKEVPGRVFRSLKRRKPEYRNTNYTFLTHKVPKTTPAPLKPLGKKRKRPLLTELFHPTKDGDLALYEQHARFVRSFLSDWSKYIDGEGKKPAKLLIVSGPPGSGKTATIDVLSRKYGFRLLELENSPSFGRDLRNATSSARESTGEIPTQVEEQYTRHGPRPYFTDKNGNVVWDSRPACVHLDCDGLAGSDAQRFIREITNAAWQAQRPMILVCNNRFSAVTMDLRYKSFSREAVYRRPPPLDLRKGILKLADTHDIEIPRATLDKVIEVCQGDIRATLTALQFSFVNSASRENNTATAVQLFNDKKKVPDLDQLDDSELNKLHERVFDYSLDTDVCWDMKKIEEIGEWNALTDSLRQSNDIDQYLRASILKYRQLFKSGKVLPYKQAHNDYEIVQRVRDTVNRIQQTANLEIYHSYSKRNIMLELLPIVSSMSDVGRSPKQDTLFELANLLYAIGVRSMGKVDGRVQTQPDISILQDLRLPLEILPVFEALSDDNKPVKEQVKTTTSRAKRIDAKNWLKPTDTQIQASKPLQPGVWLDFKISDENQAKRNIGLRDLFA